MGIEMELKDRHVELKCNLGRGEELEWAIRSIIMSFHERDFKIYFILL